MSSPSEPTAKRRMITITSLLAIPPGDRVGGRFAQQSALISRRGRRPRQTEVRLTAIRSRAPAVQV